ncbi:response regulator [Streptomyces sp. BHT-5-2]|uniref:response regulator n=1 Tax=Streptomyces sp. BHT-5-2 TaxID=2866715 RepID=UPI001C8D07EB|nr:response regulator [Streptomyces sp. BHT-5-2]QZL03037.1 response regulator [Streptomyces sp. BHT-5-2]
MTSSVPDTAPILIVDDMEENLVALEAVLGSLTPKVVRARSGEEALKAMLREEFAVVLIDVLMPGMNGFETAANIKGLDQTKDVPIILLTGASVDPNYAYRGYTVGAADFLIKPFDPWLLRTKVNVFLDLYRKNHQLAAQADQLKRLLTGPEEPAAGPAPTEPHTFHPHHPAPSPPSSVTPDAGTEPREDDARLSDIASRLAQIELLLREAQDTGAATGTDVSGLADRIAALEESVERLMAGREA